MKALVIGSGIGGLLAALKLSERAEVILVTKRTPEDGATRFAQGGIASVWSRNDSFEKHKQDTLSAGAGLCDERIVDLCVREGPDRVRELIAFGVPFTSVSRTTEYDLHREGGHSERRILHVDDLTGQAIVRTLLDKVRATPSIHLLEHRMAVNLATEGRVLNRWRSPGRCLGAYVLDTRTGQVEAIQADATVLATGGAGKAYLYTSNPDTATGDGIALGARVGAAVADLEFIQFHPTCLYHPRERTFLVSEAVRGEGAVLRTLAGEDFMRRHHSLGSLAPRDVVARSIDAEMKRSGDPHVLLDTTSIGAAFAEKFPNIHATCLGLGIDPAKQPIPVVPAAHYLCGGLVTDEHGRTSIEGLYAVGEVACTGLHGANRLASNSLLEAAVFAHRAAGHALARAGEARAARASLPRLPEWDSGHAVEIEEQIDIRANWLELRTLMWNYVGIVRSPSRLARATHRIEVLKKEVNAYYWDYLPTQDLLELRNLLAVCDLIVQAAQRRKESVGLHYMIGG